MCVCVCVCVCVVACAGSFETDVEGSVIVYVIPGASLFSWFCALLCTVRFGLTLGVGLHKYSFP